jgi:hypothetical protein
MSAAMESRADGAEALVVQVQVVMVVMVALARIHLLAPSETIEKWAAVEWGNGIGIVTAMGEAGTALGSVATKKKVWLLA